MTALPDCMFSARKLLLSELLAADIPTLNAEVEGDWIIGFPKGGQPALSDEILLVDVDPYTDEDPQTLTYESIEYALVLDLNSFEEVIDFRRKSELAGDAETLRKSLLYYIACDAFYDGSSQAENNWSVVTANGWR